MQREFQFDVHAVMADGIYDNTSILNYIISTSQANPRVALNPRNTKDPPERTFSKAGNPFCEAHLEMLARGTFHDKVQNRWRRKWVCPIHHSKKIAQYLYAESPCHWAQSHSQLCHHTPYNHSSCGLDCCEI
jgi:hypothetical protein